MLVGLRLNPIAQTIDVGPAQTSGPFSRCARATPGVGPRSIRNPKGQHQPLNLDVLHGKRRPPSLCCNCLGFGRLEPAGRGIAASGLNHLITAHLLAAITFTCSETAQAPAMAE